MSDIYGSFGLAWTPPVPGTYQIIATFEGTESYGGSSASAYMVVAEAAESPQPTVTRTTAPTVAPTAAPTATPSASPSVVPEPEAQPSADIYIIATAAIVVIVLVVVAAVQLRKRR
jgi:hypothetical protein